MTPSFKNHDAVVVAGYIGNVYDDGTVDVDFGAEFDYVRMPASSVHPSAVAAAPPDRMDVTLRVQIATALLQSVHPGARWEDAEENGEDDGWLESADAVLAVLNQSEPTGERCATCGNALDFWLHATLADNTIIHGKYAHLFVAAPTPAATPATPSEVCSSTVEQPTLNRCAPDTEAYDEVSAGGSTPPHLPNDSTPAVPEIERCAFTYDDGSLCGGKRWDAKHLWNRGHAFVAPAASEAPADDLPARLRQDAHERERYHDDGETQKDRASVAIEREAAKEIERQAKRIASLQGTIERRNATYSKPNEGWVCFHCGERFLTYEAGVEHFGKTPRPEPTVTREQYRAIVEAVRANVYTDPEPATDFILEAGNIRIEETK